MIKVSGNTYRTGWPYLLALLLLLPSCRQEDETAFTVGDSGFFLSLVEVAEENLTRTAPSELGVPEPELFHLLVLKDDGRQIYDDNYASEIPAPLGSYTLTASYGENVSLGLDAPYYEGTATAELTETAPHADVTIGCRVANALLSVKYVVADAVADGEEQTYTESDTRFRKFFSDFGVKVSIGNQSVMLKNATASSAYFPAGSTIALQFYGTMLDPAGKTVTYDIPDTQNLFSDIAAGNHLILSLSYASIDTGVVLTVEKVEVKQETISATIPLEWLPAPKLTGFADGSNVVTYTETADAVSAAIGYTTFAPLQDVEFTLDFQDENLNALNGTYLLSELTSEEKVTFAEAGIVIPVLGTQTGNFDFTGMTPALLTNRGADVVNTIKLRVKANNRWSSEEGDVYTIKTVKPEFTVSVYPGNLWTKEFTVNELMESEVVTGSYAKLSTDMMYQYSTDGNTWTTIPGDRRQAGLTPNVKYYVRGLYRGNVPGSVIEISTYPIIEMENGDMEDWTAEERGYYYNIKSWGDRDKLRVYYPWTTNQYWNTNNDFTTRNRDASASAFSTVYKYNSFPAVSYTKDVHGGTWAAELRNTAAGRGNTSSSSSSHDFNNVSGELFIGSITVTENGTDVNPNDSYTINPGTSFSSRPTALRFYYKYTPYTTDSWKVYVAIYDKNDNIIAENTITGDNTVSSYAMMDVPFNYIDDVNIVPAKIYVYFASSVHSGADLPYQKRNVTTWYGSTQRTDETLSGSVFVIDDISLIYDK